MTPADCICHSLKKRVNLIRWRQRSELNVNCEDIVGMLVSFFQTQGPTHLGFESLVRRVVDMSLDWVGKHAGVCKQSKILDGPYGCKMLRAQNF